MTGARIEGGVRVAKVVAAYVVGAAALWMLLPAIQRTFLLPELFGTLTRGALVVGVLLAALVAWHYPRMGVSPGSGPEDEPR